MVGILKRVHRRLREAPATGWGVTEGGADAAHAAERWAIAEREREEAEVERERAAASAQFVKDVIRANGSFFPGDRVGMPRRPPEK